eukprot:9658734-Lingulodinium_polyedra.AAC.1
MRTWTNTGCLANELRLLTPSIITPSLALARKQRRPSSPSAGDMNHRPINELDVLRACALLAQIAGKRNAMSATFQTIAELTDTTDCTLAGFNKIHVFYN